MKKIILLFLVIVCTISQPLFATKYTWTGATNSYWSVNTNWSPYGVPTATDTVKIVSTSNNPVLQSNSTIKELEFTSGSLNLNTFNLTVTNNSYFYSGTISNGNLVIRGTYSLYNGTTFSCTIDAIVGRTVFNGGTFNSASSFEQTSAFTSNGTGGCVFNAAVTIKKSGNSYLNLGMVNADVFNGVTKIINSSNYAIQLGYNAVSYFNDSLIFESTGSGGINFASGTGGATLANGKVITVGPGGFNNGALILKNFTQNGSTAQSIITTNSAVVSLVASTFNGALTLSSPGFLLKTSTFNGITDFTKSSSSSSLSDGGNIFNSAATFRNISPNTASLRLALQERDIFNSDVTFITTNGYISPAFNGVSEFKGSISINSNLVVFNLGAGTVSCNGPNNQTFSGTANFAIGKLLINKPSGVVTLAKPVTLDSSLTLSSGKLVSSATNLLSLKAACVLNGGNLSSFIVGPVKKTGNSAFKFAVGKGNDYRPVSISNSALISDAYTIEYFNSGQSLGSSLDTSVNYISDCNYWKIDRNNGTSNVNLTFDWFNKQCDVFDFDSTKLCRWSGTKWIAQGLMSYSGNDSIGSNSRNFVNEFGYFTFGHKLFPKVSFSYSVDTLSRPYKAVFINQSRGFKPNTSFLWSYGEIKNGIESTQLLGSKSSTEYSYFLKRNYLGSLEATQNGINYSTNKLIILKPTIQATVDLFYNPYDTSNTNPYPCIDSSGIKFSTCFTPILLTCKIDSLAQTDSIKITFPFSAGFTFSILNYTTNLSCVSTNDSVLTISSNATQTIFDSVNVLVYVNDCSVLFANRIQIGSVQLSSNMNKVEYFKNGQKINALAGVFPFSLTVNRSSIELETISNTSNFTSKIDKEFSLNEIVDRYYYIKPIEGITDLFVVKAKYEDDIDVLRVDVVNIVDTVETLIDTVYDSLNPPIIGGTEHDFVFYNPNKIGLPVGFPSDFNHKSYIPIGLCQPINADTNCTSNYNYLFCKNASQNNKILIRERIRIKSIQNCEYDTILKNRTEYSTSIICNGIDKCNEKESIKLNVESINPERIISPALGWIKNNRYVSFSSSYPVNIPISNNQLTVCDDTIGNEDATREIEYAFILKNAFKKDSTVFPSNTIRLSTIEFSLFSKYYQWNELIDSVKSGKTKIRYGNLSLEAHFENLDSGSLYAYTKYVIYLDSAYNDSVLRIHNPNINNSFVTDKFNPYSPNNGFKYLPKDSIIGVSITGLKLRDCGSGTNDPLQLKDDSIYNGAAGLLLFKSFDVKFYNMCQISAIDNQSPPPSNVKNDSTLRIQFNQIANYNGNSTGRANPSDVTVDQPQTVLTFDHKTIAPVNNRPWLIDDIMSCPNRKAYGILTLEFDPSKVGGADSSSGFPSYFVNDSANFTFNINGTATSFIGYVVIIDSMHWKINWPDTLPNLLMDSLDVQINLKAELTCGNSSSWGLDKFTIRFYEACDDNCTDCSILYGSTGTYVLRHCFGLCPVGNFVDTRNFIASRRTFGWASEDDFNRGLLMPSSCPDTSGSTNLTGYYPYDIVNLSAKGFIGEFDTTTYNYGIDDLEKFYFDVRYLTKDLPYSNTSSAHISKPLFIPVSGAVDTTSGLWFKAINTPIFGCGVDSFFVPSSEITTSTLLDPKDTLGNITIVRIEMNLNYQPIGCTYILENLLQSNSYQLNLDLNLMVNDLGKRVFASDHVDDGFYPLNPLFSMFSYTTIDSLSGDTIYHPSCDPWTSNLTYYQITPSFQYRRLDGPSYNDAFFGARPNQCQLLWSHGLFVSGGLPSLPDFPGEYRPVFEFPKEFLDTVSNALYNKDGANILTKAYSTYRSNYALKPLLNGFDAVSYDSTFKKGVDKVYDARTLFYAYFNKDCGFNNSNSTIDSIKLSSLSGDITFGAYAGKRIVFDSLPKYFYYYPNNMADNFKLDFTSNNTFQNILSNPSQPLNFTLTYKPNSSNPNGIVAPDAYVYFTGVDSIDGDFKLYKPQNGSKILLPSFRNSSVPGIIFFKVDTLVKEVAKELILEVQWNNCEFFDSTTRQFNIIAHSGLACKGYGAMQVEQFSSNDSVYSCIEFVSDTINLTIGESSLTVDLVSYNDTINGCGQFNISTQLTSLEADVTNGFLTIQTFPGIVLLPNLSTVYDTSGNPLILSSLATPSVTDTNGLVTWRWPIDSILHNLLAIPLSDIHFNNDVNYNTLKFNLEFATNGSMPGQLAGSYQFNITATGNDLCGSVVNELGQSEYISYVNPPNGYVYINQTGTLCNGDSVVLSVLDSNVNATNYLWSTGDSSQSIIVTAPGLYTVEVRDSICTYYALINIYASPASILSATDTIPCNGQPILLTATDSCPFCTFLWNNGAITNQISVDVAGIYVASITDSLSGCTTIDSIIVFNTGFQASLNATNAGLICNGIKPFTPIITASSNNTFGGPLSYAWYTPFSPNPPDTSTIVASTSGTYIGVITNSFGCTDLDTILITNITPDVYFDPSTINSIGGGTPVSLIPKHSNLISSTYLWSNGTTMSTDTIYASSSSTHILTVTNTFNGYSCSDTGIVNIIVDSAIAGRCIYYNNEINTNLFATGNQSTIATGNYDLNKDVLVYGYITIGQNSSYAIAKDVSITVLKGSTLNIEFGAHLFSCGDDMWDGIIVEPGGTLIIFGDSVAPVLIENAKIAVLASGTASITAKGNTTFNSNFISVYLHDGDFSDADFTGSKFTCTKFLEKPYNNSVNDRFTNSHIKAINAGTVNLGLSSIGNEFYDAGICVEAYKTNLNVDHCKFDQTNFSGKSKVGIFASNWKSLNPMVVNIGLRHAQDLTTLQNDFTNSTVSIDVKQGVDANIFDNRITGGTTGIRLNEVKFKEIKLVNNEINYANDYGILLTSCANSDIYIYNNTIRAGTNSFNPLYETQRGISVLSKSLITSNLLIDHNEIENCRLGIQLRHHEGGYISNNIIKYNISDAEILASTSPYYRKGIVLEWCRGASIRSLNTVSRDASLNTGDPAVNDKLIGIFASLSSDYFTDNATINLPTGFKINGNCNGAQFRCNVLESCNEGFRLVNPLLQAQGDSLFPSGNKWMNWGSSNEHIKSVLLGLFTPTNIDWWYDPNKPDETPSIKPGYVFDKFTSGSSSCIDEDCPGCLLDRIHAYIQESNDTTINEEYRYYNQDLAYSLLKDSLQLMYSGATYDAELQNFYNLMSLSNLGQLSNVQDLLKDDDIAAAYLLNESINPENLIEQNTQEVNRVVIAQDRDSICLTQEQKNILLPIAYQLPILGGEAVYRARTLLGIDLDESILASRFATNYDDMSFENYQLYPNPNNGSFSINYTLQKDERAQITIMDAMGKLLQTVQLSNEGNFKRINLTNQQNGFYFVTLSSNLGSLMSWKLIIHK
jgi:hypothetical protein